MDLDWWKLYNDCMIFINRHEDKLMACCLDELSGEEITPEERNTYNMLIDIKDIRFKGKWLGIEHIGPMFELYELVHNGGTPSTKLTNFYYAWYNIKKPEVYKDFYFYTWTSKSKDKKIPDTEENIQFMRAIGNTIFDNDKFKRFKSVIWKIETGKNKDKPNLHMHALIRFENPKNIDRDFRKVWMHFFGEFGLCELNKKAKQFYKGDKYSHIYIDKMNYLNNKDKSILHQNYRDITNSLHKLG